MELTNKKVAILGIGIEGVALFDYLKDKAGSITLCDQYEESVIREKAPEIIKEQIDEMFGDDKVEKRFGSDYLKNLKDFEVIFRSPGIPYLTTEIQEAKKSGVEISSQIKLFFDLCPCKIVGVTGTKGKGTTSSLISEILKKERGTRNEEQGGRNIYLAGNIGYPAISLIPKLKTEDIVILELSSFQLQDLEKSPNIAVFTNLGVDHLDNHATIDEYQEAKFNIFKYQTENDLAVINADSTYQQEKIDLTKSKKLYFSKTKEDADASVVKKDDSYAVVADIQGKREEVCDLNSIKLLGRHNLENIAAATLVSDSLGVDLENIRSAVSDFVGLPHRLEFVRSIDGVDYVNDSFATNPGPTMAAIASFDKPKIMILGGSSKGADFSEMAKEISVKNVKAVIVIGVEGPKIKDALIKMNFEGNIVDGAQNIDEILKQAKGISSNGDIVLFSPACASFDMFKNYKDRGEKYKLAVGKL